MRKIAFLLSIALLTGSIFIVAASASSAEQVVFDGTISFLNETYGEGYYNNYYTECKYTMATCNKPYDGRTPYFRAKYWRYIDGFLWFNNWEIEVEHDFQLTSTPGLYYLYKIPTEFDFNKYKFELEGKNNDIDRGDFESSLVYNIHIQRFITLSWTP